MVIKLFALDKALIGWPRWSCSSVIPPLVLFVLDKAAPGGLEHLMCLLCPRGSVNVRRAQVSLVVAHGRRMDYRF
jgi:hypothetical protein